MFCCQAKENSLVAVCVASYHLHVYFSDLYFITNPSSRIKKKPKGRSVRLPFVTSKVTHTTISSKYWPEALHHEFDPKKKKKKRLTCFFPIRYEMSCNKKNNQTTDKVSGLMIVLDIKWRSLRGARRYNQLVGTENKETCCYAPPTSKWTKFLARNGRKELVLMDGHPNK